MGKLQMKLVSKVGLKLAPQMLAALSDNFFPLHIDPLLNGRLYRNRGVFDDILKTKGERLEKFKFVSLSKAPQVDGAVVKQQLRALVFHLVQTRQFDRGLVGQLLQSDENVDRLEEFYEHFIESGTLNEQNFNSYYTRYLVNAEDYIVINEKLARSTREFKKVNEAGGIGLEDRMLLSSQQIIRPQKEDLLTTERQAGGQLPTPPSGLSNRLLPPKEVQSNLEGLVINKPAELAGSKFALNVFKLSKEPITDEAFCQKMEMHNAQYGAFEPFDRTNSWPISVLLFLNPLAPWNTKAEVLLKYFGFKITVYFKFTIFLLSYLYLFMFVGLALWIYEFVIWYFTNEVLYYVLFGLRWAFVFMIIIWIGLLSYILQRMMKHFRQDTGTARTAKKTERIRFKSKQYERSLITDELNDRVENQLWVGLKLGLLFLFSMVFYGAGFAATIGIFYAKNAVIRSSLPYDNYVYLNHNFMNAVEIIRMMIWDFMFRRISVKLMNRFVNPKYVEDFQNFLIYLLFVFSLFNHFFVLIAILFFKNKLSSIGCAPISSENAKSLYSVKLDNPDLFVDPSDPISAYSVSGECYFEAHVYLKFYLIFKLIWSGLKLAYYFFQKYKIRLLGTKILDDLRARRGLMDKKYRALNSAIEEQILLKPTSESTDYDTTIITFLDVC